jgi:hypothetical protein
VLDRQPTLAAIIDDGAAVFRLHGDGPAGTRALEPITYLASAVERDHETMQRIHAVVSSIDDLGTPQNLTRVAFATEERAAAALGIASDMRAVPVETFGAGGGESYMRSVVPKAPPYGWYTGFYQRSSGELTYGPRVSAQLLHPGFTDTSSIREPMSAIYAARIGPHELVHSLQAAQPPSSDPLMQAAWDGATEATASIIGTLRSGTMLRALGEDVVGLQRAGMYSNYNGLSGTLSGLARLGGHSLDDPGTIARLEQRLATSTPLTLVDELSRDAGRWQRVGTDDIRDAAHLGLATRESAAFDAAAGALHIREVDSSLEWMFTEARRRAGVVAGS